MINKYIETKIKLEIMKTKKGQQVFNEIVDAFANEGYYIPETHPGISYKGCLFNVADINAAIKTKMTK